MGFGALAGLDAVGKIANIAERMMNDSGLRQKFEDSGEVSVLVKIEEYEIDLTLRRRKE